MNSFNKALSSSLPGGASGSSPAVAASGAGGSGGAGGSNCCSSASERIADNRARGAPDGFETNNERICREQKSSAYCEAGVTERKLNLGGLERFGTAAKPAARPNEEPKKAALECQSSAKLEKYGYRSTNNPQIDTGCKLVAFDLCLFKEAGADVKKDARTQCYVLSETAKSMGGTKTACEDPCAEVGSLFGK
jgi:hypothetical protein